MSPNLRNSTLLQQRLQLQQLVGSELRQVRLLNLHRTTIGTGHALIWTIGLIQPLLTQPDEHSGITRLCYSKLKPPQVDVTFVIAFFIGSSGF